MQSAYDLFRNEILVFMMYLGGVSYLQYRYQNNRLYTLVALDAANPMSTAQGNGAGVSSASKEYFLLIPFLIVAQVWQLYLGYRLSLLWYSSKGDIEWQVGVLGSLFLIIGLGNFYTSVVAFRNRRKIRIE